MTEAKKTTKKTLVEALAAFQADLPPVDLNSVNPHFKSKYASLGNITKKVFPKLSEHGFAFSVGSFVDNGALILDAHLIHESGESRSAQFPITETNPQKVGSAVSYYRRYALAALTGIVADEDDDGNAASTPSAAERKVQAAKATPQPKPTGEAPSQAQVREWIGDSAERKEQANATYQKLKTEKKLSGAPLWDAVKAELI